MTAESMEGPDLARRAAAFCVDLLVVAFLLAVLGFVGPVLAAAYVAFRDGLAFRPFCGRSLGKAALGLTVVREGAGSCDARCSLLRNSVFAIPCLLMVVPLVGWIAGPVLGFLVSVAEAAFVVLNPEGKRFGDDLARTHVVAASPRASQRPAQ